MTTNYPLLSENHMLFDPRLGVQVVGGKIIDGEDPIQSIPVSKYAIVRADVMRLFRQQYGSLPSGLALEPTSGGYRGMLDVEGKLYLFVLGDRGLRARETQDFENGWRLYNRLSEQEHHEDLLWRRRQSEEEQEKLNQTLSKALGARKAPYGHTAYTRTTGSGALVNVGAKGAKPLQPEAPPSIVKLPPPKTDQPKIPTVAVNVFPEKTGPLTVSTAKEDAAISVSKKPEVKVPEVKVPASLSSEMGKLWWQRFGFKENPGWDGRWVDTSKNDPKRYDSQGALRAAQHLLRMRELRLGGKVPDSVIDAILLFAISSMRATTKMHEKTWPALDEWLAKPESERSDADLVERLRPLGNYNVRLKSFKKAQDFNKVLREGMKKFPEDGRSLRVWLMAHPEKKSLGLKNTKISFCLELLGYHIGCVDVRLIKHMTGLSDSRVVGKIASKISENEVGYRLFEDALRRSTSYKESDPEPIRLGVAQWRMWNAQGGGDADHAIFWKTIARLTGVSEFAKALGGAPSRNGALLGTALQYSGEKWGTDSPAIMDVIPILASQVDEPEILPVGQMISNGGINKALPRPKEEPVKQTPTAKASKQQVGAGGQNRYSYPDENQRKQNARAGKPKASAPFAEPGSPNHKAPQEEAPEQDPVQVPPPSPKTVNPVELANQIGVSVATLQQVAQRFEKKDKEGGRESFQKYMRVHLKSFMEKHSLDGDYFGLLYDALLSPQAMAAPGTPGLGKPSKPPRMPKAMSPVTKP